MGDPIEAPDEFTPYDDDKSEEQVVEGKQQAIGGYGFLLGCGPWEATIQSAVAKAHQVIQASSFRECLNNAFLTYGSNYPEQVISRLINNSATQIFCSDRGAEVGLAEAAYDLPGNTEQLLLNSHHLNYTSANELASVIIHEVLHNRNYFHVEGDGNYEFFFSFPFQAQLCALSVLSGDDPPKGWGSQRSSLVRTQILSPVGSNMTTGYELRCPSGGLVKGLRGRSGSAVDQIGLNCASDMSGTAGGNGGSAFTTMCNSDEIVVGIHGTAENYIRSIGPVCRGPNGYRYGALRGGTGPIPFQRICPSTQGVKAFSGRAGMYVDQIKVECGDNSVGAPEEVTLPSTGGTGGTRLFERCSGLSALKGITYHTGGYFDPILRMGGVCIPGNLWFDPAQQRFVDRFEPATGHPLHSHGGNGGNTGGVYCPGDYVIVGLRLHANDLIRGFEAICAYAPTWDQANPPASHLEYRPLVGRAVATGPFEPPVQATTVMCPKGRYISGWWIRAGSAVDSIQPICRNF